jgi:hypothetical protein
MWVSGPGGCQPPHFMRSCRRAGGTREALVLRCHANSRSPAQEELIMPKLPLAATAVASVLVTLATGSVAQTFPPDFPLAVICFVGQTQTWRIGYLQEVSKDGSAVYVAAAGHLRVTVNANSGRWKGTLDGTMPQVSIRWNDAAGKRDWRPSSFTQYINGRTASREIGTRPLRGVCK